MFNASGAGGARTNLLAKPGSLGVGRHHSRRWHRPEVGDSDVYYV